MIGWLIELSTMHSSYWYQLGGIRKSHLPIHYITWWYTKCLTFVLLYMVKINSNDGFRLVDQKRSATWQPRNLGESLDGCPWFISSFTSDAYVACFFTVVPDKANLLRQPQVRSGLPLVSIGKTICRFVKYCGLTTAAATNTGLALLHKVNSLWSVNSWTTLKLDLGWP